MGQLNFARSETGIKCLYMEPKKTLVFIFFQMFVCACHRYVSATSQTGRGGIPREGKSQGRVAEGRPENDPKYVSATSQTDLTDRRGGIPREGKSQGRVTEGRPENDPKYVSATSQTDAAVSHERVNHRVVSPREGRRMTQNTFLLPHRQMRRSHERVNHRVVSPREGRRMTQIRFCYHRQTRRYPTRG